MKRPFLIVSVVLVCLALLNTAGWHYTSNLSARYYDLINVSGKQRMLTQRIAYFSTKGQLDKGDLIQLESALNLIKQNHLKFISGAAEFNLKKPQPGDPFHELFFGAARLDKGIQHLIKAVEHYVKTEGSERPFDINSTIPNQLLSKTNLAVELYLSQAKQSTQKLIHWLMLLNIIGATALLMCVAWLYKQLTPDALPCESLSADDESGSPSSPDFQQQQHQQQQHEANAAMNTQARPQPVSESVAEPMTAASTNTYATDLPHPLEFKRLLWISFRQDDLTELLHEMRGIVGIQHGYTQTCESALVELQQAEAQHRAYDMVICPDQAHHAQLTQTLATSGLTQEYCVLYQTAENAPQDAAAITLQPLSQAETIVTRLADAITPYKHLLHHEAPSFSQKQVLLVDDNDINLMVLQGLVKSSDVQCTTARDGIEAVAAAREQLFDLILMDLQMPNMDGYEATEQILASTQNNATPVVAITANHSYQDRQHCHAIGMQGCEAKPVHHADIEKILYKYL